MNSNSSNTNPSNNHYQFPMSNPPPPPIQNTTNTSNPTPNPNELPTPPSIPLPDPSTFPPSNTTTNTNHNKQQNGNIPSASSTNPIPLSQPPPPPPPAVAAAAYHPSYHHNHPSYPHPSSQPTHPPSHPYSYSKYPTHPNYHHHISSYPASYHHRYSPYPSHPTYPPSHPPTSNPSYTHHPHPNSTYHPPSTTTATTTTNTAHSPYPAFNGIAPKTQSSATKPPNPLHVESTANSTANAAATTTTTTKPQSAKPSPSHSQPATTNNSTNANAANSKSKPKPTSPIKQAIIPTYRPFFELPEHYKSGDDSEDDMDVDHDTEENDSDYDPNTIDDHSKKGGKKKSKKKTKTKKKKTKRKKRKRGSSKKQDSDDRFTMYLATQTIKVTKKESIIPTKALKWAEFRSWLKQNLVSYCHQHPDRQQQQILFTRKMQKLLNFCTKITLDLASDGKSIKETRTTYYCLWLQIPQKEKWIQLIINDGDWFTNCTSEQTMMHFTTKPGSKHYWFFRIIENQSTNNNTILLLRADKGGICGELVWLQKGVDVSGTDALAIENAISAALDLKWTYLHDDSKIKIPGNSSRGQNCLYLKTVRSIAKGKSWYAQALYAPFNCNNWPCQSNMEQTGVDQGTIFTQNAKEYKDAIQYVRNMSIKQLRIQMIENTNWDNHKAKKIKHDLKQERKKKKRKGLRNGSKAGHDDDEFLKDEPLNPSDIRELDDILENMNSYDPYFTKYGTPKRLEWSEENTEEVVNIEYFVKSSDDEYDINVNGNGDDESDDDDDVDLEPENKPKRGRPRKHPIQKKKSLPESFTTLTRRTRSRSRKNAYDHRKEKLEENSQKCQVGRWRRRRIKIRHSKDVPFEYIQRNEWDQRCIVTTMDETDVDMKEDTNTNTKDGSTDTSQTEEKEKDNRVIVEYKKRLQTVAEVTAVLYVESNPAFWGKNKGYGVKVIRGAKENLLKFFKKVLTSLEDEKLAEHKCTPGFLKFHQCLKSIENTKIFGKRGRTPNHPKLQQQHQRYYQQQQQQRNGTSTAHQYYPNYQNRTNPMYYNSNQPVRRPLNNKDNPIRIPSSANTSVHSSPNKNRKNSTSPHSRHESTEPLINVATKKQIQIDRHAAHKRYQQQQQSQSLYQRRQYAAAHRQNVSMYYPPRPPYSYGAPPNPHWSYRGYGTSTALTSGLLPPHLAPPNPLYTTGYNQQLRHELAGDAEKLKQRQMQEKLKLDQHKTFLQKDLDSHLVPSSSPTNNSNSNTNSKKSKMTPITISSTPKVKQTNIKNKELFDSLKGPMAPIPKKTVQPPLRVHRNLVDSIASQSHSNSPLRNNHNHNRPSPKQQQQQRKANHNNSIQNDTDSTLSTLTVKSQNNDSDFTINTNMNTNHNVNINMPDTTEMNGTMNSTINAPKDQNAKTAKYQKKDIIVLDSDETEQDNNTNANNTNNHEDESSHDEDDDDIDNRNDRNNAAHSSSSDSDEEDTSIKRKTHMTRSRTKQSKLCGSKRALKPKQRYSKRLKLDISPSDLPEFKPNMSTDELVEEIRKYDSSFAIDKKWCRYCGSKLSTKWHTQNRMILCDSHNKQYKKDKLFQKKINRYRKIPRKPIDKSKNTQRQYLETKLKSLISKRNKLK